ncbi:MAG: alanine--glyoxylate aminotransferase family protein [Gracilibacteraceae bacterium]|jgi:aspartate aminotransferase-like enzyme|nr:alanine--glyoxylate aminotransferase family protein [Gracilibacteraceae bacterium]
MPNKELLLIPGPTPVTDEVYAALARETMAHTDTRLAALFKEALALTGDMFHSEGEVYVVAGSGTLAMEMALTNTVAPGEKLLVVSHGYFGDRFLGVAAALGIQAESLSAPPGVRVSPAAVDAALGDGGFKAVAVTHADTSTGVLADVDTLVPIVKKHGVLFLLDGVCASAAVPEDMSRVYGSPDYRIDLVLTASQKAIGAPPGLAIVTFGPAALKARAALPKVGSYYCDIANWREIMREPSRYFATHPVNMIYAYHAAMKIIEREGLAARYARHAGIGVGMRAALTSYGFSLLTAEGNAAPTLSCFLYPARLEDISFRAALKEKKLIVAGLLGALSGKGFRMGHMGNTREEEFLQAIAVIGETLRDFGLPADIDRARENFLASYYAAQAPARSDTK